MRVVRDPRDLAVSAAAAFVPTMGALHEGHAALIRRAAAAGGPVVVSIFVNPTQFGPAEDFAAYPRRLERDLDEARSAGAAVVFVPSLEAMYPPGEAIEVPPLPPAATEPGLEDACRPGHFAGVCQVVARLFDLVRPVVAVFGEKDYQQLLVVREMVEAHRDRWGALRIEAHPTVRDRDGLALSSRNDYLRTDQRDQALGPYRALCAGGEALRRGTRSAAEARMHRVLIEHGLEVDYAVVRDARTLGPLSKSAAAPARGLVAARLGRVRLIDNMGFAPDPAG
jgi:pantoate--beta-alanine ligase